MVSKPPVRVTPQKAAESLRSIGQEVVETDDQGRSITRKEKLDRLLWQEAIGWTEYVNDPSGTRRSIIHPPNITVALRLKEQLDGKAAVAQETAPVGPTAAAKVRALAVERLNALAAKRVDEQVSSEA